MDDYLSEREQWEQVKTWLRENLLWILAGIAVGAGALGGWHWYQDHLDSQGAEASAKYQQTIQAFSLGDRTKAFVLIGELERDYASSPYVDQAKLMAARVYVDSNELDKAAAELQGVSEHSKDSPLATIARMRLARVQVAQGKPDVALATLNGMQAGAFGSQYHEILGDAYFAKGDKAQALKEYLSAKVGNLSSGEPGDPGLELKVSDLTADSAPVAKAVMPAGDAAAK